jgi:hypothetical protein
VAGLDIDERLLMIALPFRLCCVEWETVNRQTCMCALGSGHTARWSHIENANSMTGQVNRRPSTFSLLFDCSRILPLLAQTFQRHERSHVSRHNPRFEAIDAIHNLESKTTPRHIEDEASWSREYGHRRAHRVNETRLMLAD